jgi:hypothetical protein
MIPLERGLDINFSNVTYNEMAPLFGLEPTVSTRDMKTFEVYRARIPTPLFKAIVKDITIIMNQYREPMDHKNAEARSRFLAPVSA